MAATSAGASEAEPRELGESGKLPFALGQMLKCFWRLGVPLELCFGQLLGPYWGGKDNLGFYQVSRMGSTNKQRTDS